MDLSIIIVNWNTKALLQQCLSSIAAHPPNRSYEILVVDNGSRDGSPEMLRRQFPQVKLLQNEENVGFARANNQVLPQCQGRYVLLLNSDTEVHANALQTLITFLEENLAAGAAGARLLNADGSLQASCSPAPTLANELLHLFHLDRERRHGMTRWNLDKAREVDVLLGACLMLRREALDVVGLLDEGYFMYSEEVDLCYRLQKAGWSLYWVPQAEVVHYGGQSTRQIPTEMFLQLYENKLRYFRKHYGPRAGRIYKLILLIASVSRLTLSSLAWLQAQPQRARNIALAGRYWRLMTLLPRL